jgi:hypothetical protein
MITIMAMTALCVGGVAFYVRFLVALFNECKRQPSYYLVCLRADGVESLVPRDEELSLSASRAA